MRARRGPRARGPKVPPGAEAPLEAPATGLRERKKAKTRAAIQRHAFRLFKRRGYDATTVEDIAEAAEVSPSTFFRYFPTKEDVVLYDATDPILFAAIRAQPRSLDPVKAVRAALRMTFSELDAEDIEDFKERELLVRNVPELRGRVVDLALRSLDDFSALLAERVGRPPDDLGVRVAVGAIFGALLSAWLTAEAREGDMFAVMDRALVKLEGGLSL